MEIILHICSIVHVLFPCHHGSPSVVAGLVEEKTNEASVGTLFPDALQCPVNGRVGATHENNDLEVTMLSGSSAIVEQSPMTLHFDYIIYRWSRISAGQLSREVHVLSCSGRVRTTVPRPFYVCTRYPPEGLERMNDCFFLSRCPYTESIMSTLRTPKRGRPTMLTSQCFPLPFFALSLVG